MGGQVQNWCCLGLLLLSLNGALCEEGSLRGALNAINRRQQDLNYPKYEKFYSESGASRYNVPDNELVFLNPSETHSSADRSPLEYLEDIDYANRQVSSAFRERNSERQRLAKMLMQESNEYEDFLREMYQQYGKYTPEILNYLGELSEKNELRKRSRHYPNIGLNMVGMKKRSPNYPLAEESADGLYLMNVPNIHNEIYTNSMAKRFPVTKRSSAYYPIPFNNEMPRQFKRSSPSSGKDEKLQQTDPKVAQDLSSIFNHPPNSKEIKDKTIAKPKRTEHATEMSKSSDTDLRMITTQKPGTLSEKEKPIQIKKKSIDWSDYFGIDKRKKSDSLDNEWLMERYHKAVALSSKRNSEDDDADDDKAVNKSRPLSSSDEKINEMDNKLKNIEYAIVDDALKASKSRDNEFDSKEVREMKDRVISQLAAAYSLEKMRRALNEYRESIKKERLAGKAVKTENNRKAEEKRLSVPRKSAGDMETAKADNDIKCSNGDENCLEQNYKTPEDLLEINNFGYCPKVQRACSEIASILGQYEKILETACVMHQMCLLCGDNTWFAPTRQCNVLYLNKAEYLCSDDVECKEVARHSTRYLLELNKLLRSEPLDTCELTC